MKCPQCGDSRRRTIDTRADTFDNIVRRTRACPNGHKFVTVEVPLSVWSAVRDRCQNLADRADRRAKMFAKYQTIVAMLGKGETVASVARRLGMARSSVVYIQRRMREGKVKK